MSSYKLRDDGKRRRRPVFEGHFQFAPAARKNPHLAAALKAAGGRLPRQCPVAREWNDELKRFQHKQTQLYAKNGKRECARRSAKV